MSSILILFKYLNRRYQRYRAEKDGQPYTEVDDEDLRPLYEETLPDGTRIPPPTPEEINFLQRNGLGNGVDWKNWRKYFTSEYYSFKKILGLVLTAVAITIGILASIYQSKILEWLAPVGAKWRALPGGWLIPIAILIVLSFPPLFGQEVVAILAGVVWGLGWGFAIVAAGTILGEVAEFYIFRFLCRGRSDKLEEKSLQWGLLATVTRSSGFTMVLMARLSLLPSHFTTVVFALAGTSFWKFLAALIISLIQPFSNVYLGVAAIEKEEHKGSNTSSIASNVTLVASILISLAAMFYINHNANKAKPDFITQRRMTRQGERSESRPGSPGREITPFRESRSSSPTLSGGPYQAPKGAAAQ
ncbi:hypothetical protein PENSPDRAFT_757124 [Peniophora sp. CONT]|nr:hypothetical protein PENSPDRAFT_757124 [Peniophora sp. CONT]